MIAILAITLFSGLSQAKPLIYMPFQAGSEWRCVQGPGGSFSHSGNLKESYDFNMGSGPNSTANPAFAEWIHSPVRGVITKVVNNIKDFQNNSSSVSANNYGYGNEVIIKVHQANFEDYQYYVRILHFKKGSVQVNVGDKVEIGTPLGQVGQTGFSTGPHLHIHMSYDSAGKYSIPFDFVEGPIYSGNWYESAISPYANLIDNDKSINAGSDFLWRTTAYSKTYWQNTIEGDQYTGSNYVKTNQAFAKFKWKFKLAKPGYFLVMARYQAHPNGDKKVLYRVIGKKYYRDQSVTSETGWNILGFRYLSKAGYTYQISLEGRTPGKQVTADALELIRIW